ncbi:MAG: HlyD family efflux transporter periplasmic adaptor subunit [Oligoflexia bacterium]|nr:HlyD family efflux transporter periplasmic adaptor subunit [Oligoflexia bacterium]
MKGPVKDTSSRPSTITISSPTSLLEDGNDPLVYRFTLWFTALMVTVFMIWAFVAKVDEVAIAPGEIIPLGHIKSVQHLDGGTISKILVGDGDLVKAGQVLLELDSELAQMQWEENKNQLDNLLSKQKILFEQLNITQDLVTQGLSSKITLLTQKAALNELDIRLAQIRESLKKTERMKTNKLIISPVEGYVHGLQLHTVGGVVAPGKTIMEIVPKEQKLVAEIKISSRDIGHVTINSPVLLKLSTYDYGRHGGIEGILKDISASTLLSNDGMPYYRGVVRLLKTHIGNDPRQHPVIPGMTLSAEIKTGEKTIMEYLLKPIYTSAKEALRER